MIGKKSSIISIPNVRRMIVLKFLLLALATVAIMLSLKAAQKQVEVLAASLQTEYWDN